MKNKSKRVYGAWKLMLMAVVSLAVLGLAGGAIAYAQNEQSDQNSKSAMVATFAWLPVHAHGDVVTQVGPYALPTPATFYGLATPPKLALLIACGNDVECMFFLPERCEEPVKHYLMKYQEAVPLQKGSYTSTPKNARIFVFSRQQITKKHPNPQWADGASVKLSDGGSVFYSWSYVLYEKETPEEQELDRQLHDPMASAALQATTEPGSWVSDQPWRLSLVLYFRPAPRNGTSNSSYVCGPLAKSGWEPVHTHGNSVTQVGSFKLPAPVTFGDLVPLPTSALLITSYDSQKEIEFFFPARYEQSVKQYVMKNQKFLPLPKGTYISRSQESSFYVYPHQQLAKDQPDQQWEQGGNVALSHGEWFVTYGWQFIDGPDGGKNVALSDVNEEPLEAASLNAIFAPDSPVHNEPYMLVAQLSFDNSP